MSASYALGLIGSFSTIFIKFAFCHANRQTLRLTITMRTVVEIFYSEDHVELDLACSYCLFALYALINGYLCYNHTDTQKRRTSLRMPRLHTESDVETRR